MSYALSTHFSRAHTAGCCFTSPKMGGKRHRGIGMNRAKKKKVEQPVSADDEVSDEAVSADDVPSVPGPEPEPEPEPCEPDPEPSPVPPAQPRNRGAELLSKVSAALHELHVVNRRWRKTLLTYYNENSGLRWATKSELARVLERLQHADDEHDEAEDFYRYCCIEYKLFKTWQRLFRYCCRQPKRLAHARLRDQARERLNEHRRRYRCGQEYRHPRPDRDMDNAQVLEHLVQTIGLAKAYQWLHLDEFRAEMNAERTPEEVEQRHMEAEQRSRMRMRASIQRRLDAEQKDPSLRFSRNCMLSWGGGLLGKGVQPADILREMGECVCPLRPQPAGTGTCVLCRAQPADATASAAGSSNS